MLSHNRYCFIPGCKSGYPKQRKEFQKNGIKNPSLFSVKAHDDETLELWKKAIPRVDREFTFVNKVCELHFKKDDIERQFLHKMPDGSVQAIERARPSLKPGAVPSIFENVPAYPSKKAQKRKVPIVRAPTSKKKKVAIEKVCIIPGCQSYSSGEKKKVKKGERNVTFFLLPRDIDLLEKWRSAIPGYDSEFKNTDYVCDLHFHENDIERFSITKLKDGTFNKIKKVRVTLKTGAVPSIFSDPLENVEDTMLSRKQFTAQHPVIETAEDDISTTSLEENIIVENFSYEKLLTTVMFLKKPNNFWSITATPNFIICARWNEDYVAEKRIVIEKNLNARVFLRENELTNTNLLAITDDDDLINLLELVESFKISAERSK